jgi:hypothetical protein
MHANDTYAWIHSCVVVAARRHQAAARPARHHQAAARHHQAAARPARRLAAAARHLQAAAQAQAQALAAVHREFVV